MDFHTLNRMPTGERIEVPRDQLSEEQVDFYLENGYLIVEDVLSNEEIAELHADLLKIARGGYPCKPLKPLPPEIGDEEALGNLLSINQPHHISPFVLQYIKHKSIVGMGEPTRGRPSPPLGWEHEMFPVDVIRQTPRVPRPSLASRRDLRPLARWVFVRRLDRDGRRHGR